MKNEMKGRVALLGILLLAGLLIAGLGTALGTGTIFNGAVREIRAVNTGNMLTIYDDGKAVQNFTLQYAENYTWTWNVSENGIVIGQAGGASGKMAKEELERQQAANDDEINKLLEVAKRDRKVQELISGKNYTVLGGGGEGSSDGKISTGILTIEMEGRYYRITIDLKNEIVTSVDEDRYLNDGIINPADLTEPN